MLAPNDLHTSRLLLRRWRADDAVRLEPILAANVAHLGPWIPRRVAEPAPLPRLMERLEACIVAFDEGREWRYGIFTRDTLELIGEVGLYPRAARGRVPFDDADHIEIGYWLRSDVTGQGFATEASRAVFRFARTLPHTTRVVIRCDEHNARSIAIPRRLGFQLAETIVQPSVTASGLPERLQVWEYRLSGDEPAVVAVSRSAGHTFSKTPDDTIRLLAGLGVEGDAHCGTTVKHRSRVARDPHQPNLRQVHLIHEELFSELSTAGFRVGAGSLGENITTRGIDLLALPRATRLHVGQTAVVEITGLRNPCVQIDRYQSGLMSAVLDRDDAGLVVRKAGVMGIVITSGEVRRGDSIEIELPPPPHRALEVV